MRRRGKGETTRRLYSSETSRASETQKGKEVQGIVSARDLIPQSWPFSHAAVMQMLSSLSHPRPRPKCIAQYPLASQAWETKLGLRNIESVYL